MEINKKILASIFVIGLLAFAMGYGTYSYFSDTAKSTGNTFTAGTLDLKLWGSSWEDNVIGTWVSPANWAPGEEVSATLKMKNVGTIGAYWLYIGIKTPVVGDLRSQVNITEFVIEELWGGYNHVGWMSDSTYSPWVIANDGYLTLEEFGMYAGTGTPYGFMAYGDDILGPSGELTLRMTFVFNPNAGNEYQGASSNFELTVAIFQEGYPVNFVQVGGSPPSYGYGN